MQCVGATLRGSARPLAEIHDVALLDLDGVVYVGPDAVPGVPAALGEARRLGMRLAFVTNNASRSPAAVAHHLRELGVAARPDEVVTSAQAAARFLADRLPADAPVLVVGTAALADALRERGLDPGWRAEVGESVVRAVVQGYSPDTTWRMLAEGAVAIERGAMWVATNVDPTVPSPRGPLPGNGSLVAALRHATGAEPIVTGKPDPTMHRETLLRTDAQNPVVIGDRLDTDIEGANAVGCPSLLVLSGVTRPVELISAPARLRPSYLAADAGGLLETHPEPRRAADGADCGRWQARRTEGGWELSVAPGPGTSDAASEPAAAADRDAGAGDDLDALRALCAAQWSTSETEPDSGPVRLTAADDPAGGVLSRLGLRTAP
jgi:glycerol-1-phosphatase